MAVFKSEKDIPLVVDMGTVGKVAEDVVKYFAAQEYETASHQLDDGKGWLISLTKGGLFRTVLGLRTALNITIEPTEEDTKVSARMGIFKNQTIPTLITIFIFWPVVFGQIWGLVRQSDLDNEAIEIVERSLQTHIDG